MTGFPPIIMARNEVTRSDLPRAVYQGSEYAVPAPKPRPNYQAARARRSPVYQAPRADTGNAPSFRLAGLRQRDFEFRRRQQWRAQ